jgi:hypothetical protein
MGIRNTIPAKKEKRDLEIVRPDFLNLTPPRYVPWVIKGTSLGVWYDTQEGQYRVLAPDAIAWSPATRSKSSTARWW